MRSTLAVGAACFRTAHAPVTCGVAIDVPLADAKPPPTYEELMDCPGANSDMSGDTLENDATASDFVVAPTLMAVETQAGELIAFVSPPLPDATTVAIPAER